ncbi:DMT family transporter [Nitratireductor luteus]|uniref:DMT family transporter n=1 Tax=Nitratireductor luteus TaxID=2976980 RepID=UPI002240A3B9|nr:DMT family transporter [Nitratireductor luteus]
MELWIPITIAAAFLQNLRSAAQKHLKGVMGTTGATFVRFGFGLPFAVLFLALLHLAAGYPLARPNGGFLAWVIVGGLTQIGATFLLIHLFSFRNFAVGTAYSRTEPAQAAVFGLIFLGELAGAGALVAIAITVLGVMAISVAHVPMSWRNLLASLVSRNALIGLSSGTLFGIAAVAYRAASLSLGGPNFMMQAATTLLFTIFFQTVVMLGWIIWKERAELAHIAKAWKASLFVGLVGASASFGWFAAMTLQQAAVVKALAQVEMIFTFASTVYFFREKINATEVAGCALIVTGIIVLVLV